MSHAATLLNKIEVTQRLKVCERTLEKFVRAGKFPRGLKLGKQVLWADAAVEKWLNQALESQLTWEPPQKPRRSTRPS